MAILGDDESWGLDNVWDMIETKLSVSQPGPAVMPACLRCIPTILTRSQMTHGGNHWGKQWEMDHINCDICCTCPYLSVSAAGCCVWPAHALGDTLHTHQASGDPCSVLDIVNVEWTSLELYSIKLQGAPLCLLKIYFESWRHKRTGGSLWWHECCVLLRLSWISRAVWVCECIHSDAPTERTLRFNLKCSVYGSVVVCLSIGINMLQIFYTSSMLINAQNRNSEHATHFAERTQTIRKIYILNSHNIANQQNVHHSIITSVTNINLFVLLKYVSTNVFTTKISFC